MCYWVVPSVLLLSWVVLPPLSSFYRCPDSGRLYTSSFYVPHRSTYYPGHRRARGAPRARVDLTIVHVVRRHVLTGIRRHLTGIRGRVGWPLLDWAPVSAAGAAPLARPKVAVSKRVVSFSYSSDTPVKPGRGNALPAVSVPDLTRYGLRLRRRSQCHYIILKRKT